MDNRDEGTPTKQPGARKRNAVRIAVIVAGGALLVVGALGGGYDSVLLKGVRVCLECIGLG